MTAIETPTTEVPPFRLRAEMNGMGEAPGKVWFFELAAAVIDADRCVQCGACVAACPTDSLGVNEENLPYLVKMCTGCSLCWDFCPRGGLRYEAGWPDDDEEPIPAVITGGVPRRLGVIRDAVAARVKADSKYVASGAQDGGFVSAVLATALDAGEIDGALIARVDPQAPWRGIPTVATTREEILDAGGSFYNQTLALAALDLTKVGLGPNARIAVVGTPCEVQGIRALQERSWRRGVSRIDAISLVIALMCTKSFDYRRLMVEMIHEDRGIDLAEIGKVDVIHGRLYVFDRSGAPIVDEPVKAFHGAALKGCDECADFAGRGADLSVGSVGSDAGYSSVLVRTDVGAEALARVAGELDLLEIANPEALEKLDGLDRRIAVASLARPFDPAGELFIDFREHVEIYRDTDRAPVFPRW